MKLLKKVNHEFKSDLAGTLLFLNGKALCLSKNMGMNFIVRIKIHSKAFAFGNLLIYCKICVFTLNKILQKNWHFIKILKY